MSPLTPLASNHVEKERLVDVCREQIASILRERLPEAIRSAVAQSSPAWSAEQAAGFNPSVS